MSSFLLLLLVCFNSVRFELGTARIQSFALIAVVFSVEYLSSNWILVSFVRLSSCIHLEGVVGV